MCIIYSVVENSLDSFIGLYMLNQIKTISKDIGVGFAYLLIPTSIVIGVIFTADYLIGEQGANYVLLIGVILYASYMIGSLKTKSYLDNSSS